MKIRMKTSKADITETKIDYTQHLPSDQRLHEIRMKTSKADITETKIDYTQHLPSDHRLHEDKDEDKQGRYYCSEDGPDW